MLSEIGCVWEVIRRILFQSSPCVWKTSFNNSLEQWRRFSSCRFLSPNSPSGNFFIFQNHSICKVLSLGIAPSSTVKSSRLDRCSICRNSSWWNLPSEQFIFFPTYEFQSNLRILKFGSSPRIDIGSCSNSVSHSLSCRRFGG